VEILPEHTVQELIHFFFKVFGKNRMIHRHIFFMQLFLFLYFIKLIIFFAQVFGFEIATKLL